MTNSMALHNGDGPRQPAGIPAGGQFAVGHHAESLVSLDTGDLSDAEYNADGTFAYPPYPRSAVQHMEFWATVPIPDIVLERVATAYKIGAMRYGERYPYNQELAAQNRVYREDWRRRAELHKQEWAGMPTSLYNPMVRPMVRAAQLYWYAEALPPEEREKVENARITLPSDQERTVKEVVEYYRLDECVDAFADPSFYDSQRLAEVINAVHDLHNGIAGAQES